MLGEGTEETGRHSKKRGQRGQRCISVGHSLLRKASRQGWQLHLHRLSHQSRPSRDTQHPQERNKYLLDESSA